MKYIIVLLAFALILCASKWLAYWTSSAALLLYIQKKGYTLPSDEEMKMCTNVAIQQFVNQRILRRNNYGK